MHVQIGFTHLEGKPEDVFHLGMTHDDVANAKFIKPA